MKIREKEVEFYEGADEYIVETMYRASPDWIQNRLDAFCEQVWGDEPQQMERYAFNTPKLHYKALGIAARGAHAGGIVFFNYSGENVEIFCHFKEELPSSAIAKALFDVAFKQIGARRVTALTQEDSALEPILLSMGFQREGVLRKFDKNRDIISLGVLEEEFAFEEL